MENYGHKNRIRCQSGAKSLNRFLSQLGKMLSQKLVEDTNGPFRSIPIPR